MAYLMTKENMKFHGSMRGRGLEERDRGAIGTREVVSVVRGKPSELEKRIKI
jgi:hypothetical protein